MNVFVNCLLRSMLLTNIFFKKLAKINLELAKFNLKYICRMLYEYVV